MSMIASVWPIRLCGLYLALETCFKKKKKKRLLVFYLCVYVHECVCLSVFVCVPCKCRYVWTPEDGIRSPGLGVVASSEFLTWVLH